MWWADNNITYRRDKQSWVVAADGSEGERPLFQVKYEERDGFVAKEPYLFSLLAQDRTPAWCSSDGAMCAYVRFSETKGFVWDFRRIGDSKVYAIPMPKPGGSLFVEEGP
jgi:hypothetical protein